MPPNDDDDNNHQPLLPPAPLPPLFASTSTPNIARILIPPPPPPPHSSIPPPSQTQENHNNELQHYALSVLETQGAVILHDWVAPELLTKCKVAVDKVVHAIIDAAFSQEQGFDDPKVLNAEARRSLGITRIAKIGAGKKNVHFDPYTTNTNTDTPTHPHTIMSHLAEASGVAALIRACCGEDVTLAETGISITRPGGCGLEWHADGREGECTVIMSLDDIEPEMGRLGVLMGSHVMVDRDECEDFDEAILEVVRQEEEREREREMYTHTQAHLHKEKEGEINRHTQAHLYKESLGEGKKVMYAYRKGQPIVFDARMLHVAEGCQEEGKKELREEEEIEEDGIGVKMDVEKYRVILWWIYNGQG